jgi:hypothetical protein
LAASSNTAIKSPILKPKLIVVLSATLALESPRGKKNYVEETSVDLRIAGAFAKSRSSRASIHHAVYRCQGAAIIWEGNARSLSQKA